MPVKTRNWIAGSIAAAVLFALGGVTHAWLAPQPLAVLSPLSETASAQPTDLPDFTALVRQNAAAVVNISVTRAAAANVALRDLPEGLQPFLPPLPDT